MHGCDEHHCGSFRVDVSSISVLWNVCKAPWGVPSFLLPCRIGSTARDVHGVYGLFFFKLHHTASAVFDCGSCNA